jgi:hypothetical protein
MEGREEVASGGLIAGGDGTKLLDLGEEILDQMARRIDRPIMLAWGGAIGSRWYHRRHSGGSQRLEDALVGVKCLIGDQRISLHRGQQVIGSVSGALIPHCLPRC